MELGEDLTLIRKAACRDKAMAAVPDTKKRTAFDAIETAVASKDKDAVLLDTMRLFALAGNGHTRLIPNAGINVFPLRLIWTGDHLWDCTNTPRTVETIGGQDVDRVFASLTGYLAGTEPRQKVIGAMPLVWPAALKRLGIDTDRGTVTYTFHDGSRTEVQVDKTVPAQLLYPVSETGWPDPTVDPYAGSTCPFPVIRLESFLDEPTGVAEDRIEQARQTLQHATGTPVILDLRGNPGGDFIRHLPILDVIDQNTRAEPPVVLVDRFTFSAAIVFAALCRDRLSATIVGEEMGDGAAFFAEGGTVNLPVSGAAIRWSDGFHDWDSGLPTKDTPPEVASWMRACGSLLPDVLAVTTPKDLHHGRDPAFEVACACHKESQRGGDPAQLGQ